MCEANAYLLTGETPVLIMESVDKAEPDGNAVRLVSIFGEQKIIRGFIHSLSLVDHKIYIREHPPAA
ncbi:CooT family nickel-binding protein [Desulfatiferula olefinivorans]